MADIHELETRYEKIPQELKSQRHWICFKSILANGKYIKAPISPFSEDGKLQSASPTDKRTWGDFGDALRFCADHDMDGLGFELGESGMFGVDIDNHNSLPEAEFQALANDFVRTLNSYTEWSVSGNGIHIICYGKTPNGVRKNDNVEIYDGGTFFAMTGKAIGSRMVRNASEGISALWERYLLQSKNKRGQNEEKPQNPNEKKEIGDDEVMMKAYASEHGNEILDLMKGRIEDYADEGEARKALCHYLAELTDLNAPQIDRIFRSSGLYDFDWDDPKGANTVGYYVIQNAIEECAVSRLSAESRPAPKAAKPATKNEMNLDLAGNPIFRISENYNKVGKKYSLDDTGNALRFYDCFGENFHWNSKDKLFMFWTGKTWIYDSKDIIRKYANKLIDIMMEEGRQMKQSIDTESDDGRRKSMVLSYKDFMANVKHLSSKNGKDAMLTEFRSLGTIPAEPTDFDQDKLKINTESGIVDLTTGEILPFDKNAMFASNTKIEVSYEEPTTWLRFLNEIYQRDDPQETADIIETYQRLIGYTLTGLTSEQIMVLLNGDGSNGKSTQSNVMMGIMGDYYGSIDSQQLMQQKNQSVSVQYSLAELTNTRFLLTSETDKGARLSESVVKQITGSTVINAQKKYGRPYIFVPKFKLWMETNNLPYINGKDYGIWRRIFLITYKRQFKDSEKDKDLPDKLRKEYPQILGWAIQGAVKYLKDKDLKQPECLKRELVVYQSAHDSVRKFIESACHIVDNGMVSKTKMYHAYKQWAMDNKEHTYPESKFREELISKGYKIFTNETNGAQYYQGLAINEDIDTFVERRGGRSFVDFGPDD